MKFSWQTIKGTWDQALIQINTRMGRLAYVLSGVQKVEGTLIVSDGLWLRNFALLEAQAATPAIPSAGHAKLYLRDNGTGKMQLVILYPSGAIGTLDTEP